MRNLLLFSLLACVGCTTPEIEPLNVPRDLPVEVREAFTSAAEEWQSAGVAIELRDVAASPRVQMVTSIAQDPKALAWTDRRGIEVLTTMRPCYLWIVAAHELGHWAGARHTASGVMKIEQRCGETPRCIDREAAAEVGGTSTCKE